jgi:hypothetical protein
MKKDLTFVCKYFKALVIPKMPDKFIVAEPFRFGLSDFELRKGMEAFRDFLYAMYDKISADKDKIDVERGRKYDPNGTPGDRGTASIKECFPVFYDLTIILLTLGFHGKLETEPEKRLAIHGNDILTVIDPITEKYQSLIKMKSERKLEMFNLLFDLGLCFNGADFSRDVDFTKTDTFFITSKRSEYFPVGLKLIAASMINNKNYYKLENLFRNIFLRGDFYPLANVKPKKYNSNIEEYVNTQHPDIIEWVIKMNSFLISKGCTMIQGMGGGSPFTYIKRNTNVIYGMVCIIEMGLTGCFIRPGINHLAKQDSIINKLPDEIVNIMKSKENKANFNTGKCFRNTGNMGFAGFKFTHKGIEYNGCRHAGLRCQYSGVKCKFTGFKFDLSDSNIRELMTEWIELELECC